MSEPSPIDPRDQKTQRVDAAVLTPMASGAGPTIPVSNPHSPATPGASTPVSKSPRTNSAFGDHMSPAGSGAPPRISVPIQDLLSDKLILSAHRTETPNGLVPTLGGIQLLAKIGQGGMGAVYYGMHPRLMQEVAVKVLPFHLAEAQPGLIQRFIREAQIAAKVRSPHLVYVIDVNEENGLFYLVMEYVNGKSAGQLLRETIGSNARGLPERTALAICIGACEGLAIAHAHGVIHRDIKPDNIMLPRLNAVGASPTIMPGTSRLPDPDALDYKGAKLADLGLARNEAGDLSMTGANACMGTPGYMAPEQANDAKHASKPADVFSLGATLYALLSGDSPFRGSSLMQVLNATVNSPHPPIKSVRADVSDATSALMDRCLAKAAGDRFPDASAMLNALRDSLFLIDDTAGVLSLSGGLERGSRGRPRTGPLATDAARLGALSSTGGLISGSAPVPASQAVLAPAPSRSGAAMAFVAAFLILLLAGAGVGGYFLWQKVEHDRVEERQRQEALLADIRRREAARDAQLKAERQAAEQRQKDEELAKSSEQMRQTAYGEEEQMYSAWLFKRQEKSLDAFLNGLKAARTFKAEKNYDRAIASLEDAIKALGSISHPSRPIAEKLLADAKDEKARALEAFSSAYKSATDYKRDQNWDKAVTALEGGFKSLGTTAHPSRTEAETLLKEVISQRKRSLDAFSTSLKSALAFKARKEWDSAFKTGNEAMKALGPQAHPDRALAEALIKEAQSQLNSAAQQEAQALEALPAAVKLATAYKVDRNWDKVLLALEGPLKAIGDKPHPNREAAEWLVKEAREQKELQKQVKAEMVKGAELLKAGNFVNAKAAYERAKKLAEDPAEVTAAIDGIKAVNEGIRKSKLSQARSLMLEGRQQRLKAEWSKAADAYKAAGILLQEIDERDDLARARMEEGDCLRMDNNKSGDWARAAALYAQAATLFNGINDKRGQAEAITREANCKDPSINAAGDARAAAQLYGRAALLQGELGNKRASADDLSQQATCVFKERAVSSADRAADIFKRAAALYEDIGEKKALGLSLYNQAVCAIKEKKANLNADSRALFQRAAKVCREAGDETTAKLADGWVK